MAFSHLQRRLCQALSTIFKTKNDITRKKQSKPTWKIGKRKRALLRSTLWVASLVNIARWFIVGRIMKAFMQTIEFETPTLDEKGEIIARTRHTAEEFTEELGHGLSLEMILVPAGIFQMGSPRNLG